jgi:hypothetical protein
MFQPRAGWSWRENDSRLKRRRVIDQPLGRIMCLRRSEPHWIGQSTLFQQLYAPLTATGSIPAGTGKQKRPWEFGFRLLITMGANITVDPETAKRSQKWVSSPVLASIFQVWPTGPNLSCRLRLQGWRALQK